MNTYLDADALKIIRHFPNTLGAAYQECLNQIQFSGKGRAFANELLPSKHGTLAAILVVTHNSVTLLYEEVPGPPEKGKARLLAMGDRLLDMLDITGQWTVTHDELGNRENN